MPDPSEPGDKPSMSGGLAGSLHGLFQLSMRIRLSTLFSIWAVLMLIMLFTNFPHLVAYLQGDAAENQSQPAENQSQEQSVLEFTAQVLGNVSRPDSTILVELVCRNTADIGTTGNVSDSSNVTVSPFPEWGYNPVFFLQTPDGSTFRSYNSRYGPPAGQSLVLVPGQEVSRTFNLFELPSTGWWIEEGWDETSQWHHGPDVFTESGEYRLTVVFYPFFYLLDSTRSSISMNVTLTLQRPRALSIAHLGEVVWERTYGGDEMDWARCISPTQTGEYVVAGSTKSFGTGEGGVYVVKVDTDGNRVWEKAHRGSAYPGTTNAAYSAYGIAQTPDGGFMLVGGCGPPDYSPRQAYVLRIDAEGARVWERSYGGDQTERANCIAAASDGSGYVVAGQTSSFGSGLEVYVFKVDGSGNLVWERTYGGNEANGIVGSGDGGFVVAGTIHSDLAGRYSENVYLFKIDCDGEKTWEGIFGGNKTDRVESIAPTRDGGFVVVGDSYSFGGTRTDLYALKVDREGNLVWERNFGGEGFDHAYCVVESHNGGVVVAGSSDSFDPSGAFYAIKIDKRGEKIWEMTGGPVGRPYGIVQTDDRGYVMAGVLMLLGVGDRDFYVLKIKDQAIPVTEPRGGMGE
jgi:hypothetical protein